MEENIKVEFEDDLTEIENLKNNKNTLMYIIKL